MTTERHLSENLKNGTAQNNPSKHNNSNTNVSNNFSIQYSGFIIWTLNKILSK